MGIGIFDKVFRPVAHHPVDIAGPFFSPRDPLVLLNGPPVLFKGLFTAGNRFWKPGLLGALCRQDRNNNHPCSIGGTIGFVFFGKSPFPTFPNPPGSESFPFGAHLGRRILCLSARLGANGRFNLGAPLEIPRPPKGAFSGRPLRILLPGSRPALYSFRLPGTLRKLPRGAQMDESVLSEL